MCLCINNDSWDIIYIYIIHIYWLLSDTVKIQKNQHIILALRNLQSIRSPTLKRKYMVTGKSCDLSNDCLRN